MSIEYTYTIVSVDATAKCMEVSYSSTGRETQLVGVRLPLVGESLEAVIDSYSPVQYWLDLEAERDVPEVGTTGVIAPVEEVVAAPVLEEHVFHVDPM